WLSFAMGGQPSTWSGAWQPIFRTQRMRDNMELQRLSLPQKRMFMFLLDKKILMESSADDDDNRCIQPERRR
ncbi:MAG: hypothetical protein ACTHNL_14045, partial [Devosia sp.]